jgi:hypothetical protein
MRFSTLYLLAGPFIRHVDKPPCVHCIHYNPDLKESFSSGTCAMYGGKDLHTGMVLYDDAHSVRQDESKCSVAGNYFVGEKHLYWKKIRYVAQQNTLLICCVVLYGVCLVFVPTATSTTTPV